MRCWDELAAQARDEDLSHENYLVAVLQRLVAQRESAGTIMRIRTAHFPRPPCGVPAAGHGA